MPNDVRDDVLDVYDERGVSRRVAVHDSGEQVMRQVLAFLSIAGAVGCTQDFGAYTPTADGGGVDVDSSSSVDAAKDVSAVTDAAADVTPDAGCTPPSSCFTTAKSCKDQCDSQRDTCRNGCQPGNPGSACRSACDATRDVCRNGCETACNTCTTNAGCPAPSQCKSAVN